MSQLFVIFLILLIGGLWLEGLRAREIALRYCASACRRQGIQLLDDTVALCRIGVVRQGSGVYLRRVYRFEFSADGQERQAGEVSMRSHQIEAIQISLPATGSNPDPI